MARVVFFEKPGCINNTRQKKLLRQSGHTVVAINLLTMDWSRKTAELRQFFAGKPVSEWFNRSAPAIKNGVVNPDRIEDDQAISLMLADPLLIRRPLMQVGHEKMAGFDELIVDRWIGLSTAPTGDNLENCPNPQRGQCSDG